MNYEENKKCSYNELEAHKALCILRDYIEHYLFSDNCLRISSATKLDKAFNTIETFMEDAACDDWEE